MEFLGVDIGVSSIKNGRVSFGEESTIHHFDVIEIPQQSREIEYAKAIKTILQTSLPYRAVCLAFPSRIWKNRILREDIDFEGLWVELQNELQAQQMPNFAMNDADAAGTAEINRKGAEELRQGVTVLLTLGSGIGSAIFLDGKMLPNTELGAVEMHGMRGELYTAASTKTQEALTMEKWAARLQEFLDRVEYIISPHHLVLGGGISADFSQFKDMLRTRATLQPAYYRNQA